jgi:NADH:ubiquinone oxidoreductase subunit 6 (subunit J)
MVLTIFFALLAVEAKRILYAVMSFSGMCITIGALFWILNAPYVAVFQLLIYAGAVVTIFLAAIMLTSQKEGMR